MSTPNRARTITALTDAFCEQHLNGDYRDLCREMAIELCRAEPRANSGKPESWAAGVVYALGQVNFLCDPTQTPHMTSEAIAKGFGVSPATMHAKARVLRDGFELMPFHPAWCLPNLIEKNPLVWMLKVNGMIVDIREMPREAQEMAYRRGLIPFIPADRSGGDRMDAELPDGAR